MHYTLADIRRLLPDARCQQWPAEDRPLTRVAFDTRLLLHGEPALFVALRGHRDGHDFLPAAYRQGIRAFLVDRPIDPADYPGAGILKLPDSLRGLQHLAREHRQPFSTQVVGITGSNGKTVVKEWLASLLTPGVELAKSPRSYNSQLGVALSVLELDEAHHLGLFEAGISQPGEMAALEEMIRPTLGVFTHFGDAHDENFATREQKLREKLQLFRRCRVVIASEQVPELADHLPDTELLRVGWDKACFWQLREEERRPDGWHIRLRERDTEVWLHLPLPSLAAQENVLLAAAAARYLGLDWERITRAVPELEPVHMRLELITGNPAITILSDAYNADEVSVRNAFSLLEQQTGQPHKRLILTDLEHQGHHARPKQQALLELAIDRFGASNITLIGPLYHELAQPYLDQGLRAHPDTASFLASFVHADFLHSTVLLKGARPFQLETIIPYLSQQAAATYLQVNLDALRHNLRVFRRHLPGGVRVMAMLKAAAYGSGAWQLARELEREHIDAIGVAYTGEGQQLRRRGVRAPILVLNPDLDTLDQLHAFELMPAVWSFDLLERLAALSQPLDVHLEFDTGMARLGFDPAEAPQVRAHLREVPHLRPVGVFSHLAAAGDPGADEFTHHQLRQFEELAAPFQEQYPAIVPHVLNSGGAIRFPAHAHGMIRLGLSLYGIATGEGLSEPLQEISSLHSTLSQVRTYPAGTSIGYGRSAVLAQATRVGTVPVGYADGLPLALSNGAGAALVRGQRCPILGRVCMDMLMLDLTPAPGSEAGDEVVFFGRQGDAEQSVEELAHAAGAIPYEILTGISERVRRIFEKE